MAADIPDLRRVHLLPFRLRQDYRWMNLNYSANPGVVCHFVSWQLLCLFTGVVVINAPVTIAKSVLPKAFPTKSDSLDHWWVWWWWQCCIHVYWSCSFAFRRKYVEYHIKQNLFIQQNSYNNTPNNTSSNDRNYAAKSKRNRLHAAESAICNHVLKHMVRLFCIYHSSMPFGRQWMFTKSQTLR